MKIKRSVAKMRNLVKTFVLLSVLLSGSCDAQRTPSISYISQEQIKDLGETGDIVKLFFSMFYFYQIQSL